MAKQARFKMLSPDFHDQPACELNASSRGGLLREVAYGCGGKLACATPAQLVRHNARYALVEKYRVAEADSAPNLRRQLFDERQVIPVQPVIYVECVHAEDMRQ